MTRDTDRPANGPTGPSIGDDEPIARLVRTVADEWRMPPQRLEQPTWRDQVGGGADAGRGAGSRVWPDQPAPPSWRPCWSRSRLSG